MQGFKVICKMEMNIKFEVLNRTDFVTSFTSLVSMSIFEDVRLVFSDGEMKLHEASKIFIKLVHSRAKLLQASVALLGHLLAKKS